MCGLCGVLGGRGHWTESGSNPDAFQSRAEKHTWHRERQARTRLVNDVLRHYGLRLTDWSGNAYSLRSNTGRTVLVDNLTELWASAEQIGRRPCDPLDAALLASLPDGGRDG